MFCLMVMMRMMKMVMEDISQASVINMLCVQLLLMLQSLRAAQSALCVVHRPTVCPPLRPLQHFKYSALFPEQVRRFSGYFKTPT